MSDSFKGHASDTSRMAATLVRALAATEAAVVGDELAQQRASQPRFTLNRGLNGSGAEGWLRSSLRRALDGTCCQAPSPRGCFLPTEQQRRMGLRGHQKRVVKSVEGLAVAVKQAAVTQGSDHASAQERKKERKIYARLQACVKGALSQ